MFLLLILFGLTALGLAFSLYMQMEIPQKPLPPIKPPASAQPAAAAATPAAIVVTVDNAPADGSTDAGPAATTNTGSGTQTP